MSQGFKSLKALSQWQREGEKVAFNAGQMRSAGPTKGKEMADDKKYLQHRKAELEAIRRGYLEAADDARAQVDQAVRERGNPTDPTRAYEHAAACDRRAENARRDAKRSTDEAEKTLTAIRGIERQLAG